MAAADVSAGRSSGNETDHEARSGDAPNTRAASSSLRSIRLHTALDGSHHYRYVEKNMGRQNRPQPRDIRLKNAAPTTTVGRTNGTVTSDLTNDRPGNSKRESAQVRGIAAISVRTVEATACPSVNHAEYKMRGRANVWRHRFQ